MRLVVTLLLFFFLALLFKIAEANAEPKDAAWDFGIEGKNRLTVSNDEWVTVTTAPLVPSPIVKVVRHDVVGRYHLYVLHGAQKHVETHLFAAETHGTDAFRRPVTLSRNGMIKAHACRTSPTSGSRGFAPGHFSYAIDITDQRTKLANSEICTGSATGLGTHIYVFDTGVDQHDSFARPIEQDYDYFSGGTTAPVGDCAGHGTHVAGLAASSIYGMAPGATVHSIRVLDCNGDGTFASLAAGLLYVIEHGAPGPKVINLSLGAQNGASASVEYLLGLLVEAPHNVVVVASAGNDAGDACSSFPGRLGSVLTVGAITQFHERAFFTNTGVCVDVYAGGQSVISTNGEASGSLILSGTSMSAPIVSGRAALLLEEHPNWTVGQVRSHIASSATPNLISGLGISSATTAISKKDVTADNNNLLLYVHPTGTSVAPPPPPSPPAPPPASPPPGGFVPPGSNGSSLKETIPAIFKLLLLPISLFFFFGHI